jgi:chemotaxis protein CheX
MISNESIFAITQSILSTMLELDAELVESTPCCNRRAITGCIQIAGTWQGAVIVQSSEELAKIFANRLLAVELEDITEDDICDSFAEMTNMIGGNIKGQVPSPSYLSLPSVTTGNDFDFRLSGAQVVREISTVCQSEALRILLCEEDIEVTNRRASQR